MLINCPFSCLPRKQILLLGFDLQKFYYILANIAFFHMLLIIGWTTLLCFKNDHTQNTVFENLQKM